MKKDEEINSEQIMKITLAPAPAESIPNGESDTETANTFPTAFYEKHSVAKPAEMLMCFILPTVTNQLKYHQEIMKLMESRT